LRLDPVLEALPLSFSTGTSFPKIRVFINVTAALLSFILALTLLNPTMLLYYLVTTSVITATLFTLRIRLHTRSFSKTPKPPQETLRETEKANRQRRMMLLMFLISIVVVVLPSILAKILDPYIWFILTVSSITGFSIAEILVYVYTRRARNN